VTRWPYPYAAEAAEFGAVGTEPCVPQLLHADEAAEDLRDALETHREKRPTVGAPNTGRQEQHAC